MVGRILHALIDWVQKNSYYCYIDSGHCLGWVQPTSASFALGLQRIATALLRNFEIGHVNCCSRNACVFLPLENIVYVSVMCGYRLVRVRQQCMNQRGSLKLPSTGGFLRIGSVFGRRLICCPAAGSKVSVESVWRSGISDPAITSSEKSLQVVRECGFNSTHTCFATS